MTIQQSNYIKLIAMITMLLDHIGVILFPGQLLFRIIGRIAFPLFAYQLGSGYLYTKNFKKYILRIILFGVLIHILYVGGIYFLKINENLNSFNIFFTLALGLAAIYCYENNKKFYLLLILSIPVILERFSIKLDYGFYGIIVILILYIERNRPLHMLIYISLFSIAFDFIIDCDYIQIYSLLALIFILYPLSLKINIPKYVFYLFYPVHLAVLYLISIL